MDPVHALYDALRALIRNTPALAAHAGDPGDLPYTPLPPRALPVTPRARTLAASVSGPTAGVTRALDRAAGHLHWRQSYTAGQVGADYLASYGWANIVSPEGPFVSDDLRLSLGFWDKGLHYPEHWHAPEETYVVLAGNAVFHSEHSPDARLHPCDTRHHVPNERHAITMDESPLLAAAIWTGEGLMRTSTLKA